MANKFDVYPIYRVRRNYSTLEGHEFTSKESADKFASALNDAMNTREQEVREEIRDANKPVTNTTF